MSNPQTFQTLSKVVWFSTHGCNSPGTIPFTFHVDGAEVFRNTEYYVWSCGSFLATGDVSRPVLRISRDQRKFLPIRFRVLISLVPFNASQLWIWGDGHQIPLRYSGLRVHEEQRCHWAARTSGINPSQHAGVKKDHNTYKYIFTYICRYTICFFNVNMHMCIYVIKVSPYVWLHFLGCECLHTRWGGRCIEEYVSCWLGQCPMPLLGCFPWLAFAMKSLTRNRFDMLWEGSHWHRVGGSCVLVCTLWETNKCYISGYSFVFSVR